MTIMILLASQINAKTFVIPNSNTQRFVSTGGGIICAFASNHNKAKVRGGTTRSIVGSQFQSVIGRACSSRHSSSSILGIGVGDENEELKKQICDEIEILNGGNSINVNSPKQVAMAIFGSEKHSTNRIILEQAAAGTWPTLNNGETSQRMAQLILLYRSMKNQSTVPSTNRLTNGLSLSDLSPSSNKPLVVLNGQATKQHRVFSTANYFYEEEIDEVNSAMASPISVGSDESNSKEINKCSEYTIDANNLPKAELNNWNYPTKYDHLIESMFANQKCKIDLYWKEPLLLLTKQSAKSILSQLDVEQCPMGYDPLARPYSMYYNYGSTASSENDESLGPDGDNVPSFDAGQASTTSVRTTTAGKKGSFLSYCREQKEKYPDCIILTRCGDFYETFGTDAIILVEHCGLNAMAGKAKAGCPIRNVQSTLNCLTGAGFRVAVYEEGADTDSSTGTGASGGAKSRIKSRFLAQIVSPASPTYLYDLVLSGSANNEGRIASSTDILSMSPQARPYVGILSMQTGYTMVEIASDERTVRVSEKLTPEAVACRLAAYPPADPLLYIPSWAEYEQYKSGQSALGMSSSSSLPFLPSRRDNGNIGPGSRLRTKVIPPTIVQGPTPGMSEDVRARNVIVSELLKLTDHRDEDYRTDAGCPASRRRVTVDDFTLIKSAGTRGMADKREAQTNPLYLETARQLGLMNDNAIPSLMSYVLPDSAPAASRRFLRRYLLTPPPSVVADAMSMLVTFFKDATPAPSIPPLVIPPVGKVLALLRAGQASAEIYADLLKALSTTVTFLELHSRMQVDNKNVVGALMVLLEYESGMAATPDSLKSRCLDTISKIEEVVSDEHHSRFFQVFGGSEVGTGESIDDFSPVMPKSFLERNEACWRGRVRREAASEAYSRVELTSRVLSDVLSKDFLLQENIGVPSSLLAKRAVLHDIFNNLLAVKEIPVGVDESLYFHPKDRNGKILRNRYTTDAVQAALEDYVAACDNASQKVASVLVELSQKLHDDGNLPSIVQASHANLILSTSFFHAAMAKSLGWNLAETFEEEGDELGAADFKGLWPYWMDQASAVHNTFTLKGMYLLTAPNMSGKSTLMRSTAAAALLATCGLCAPLGLGSKIRKFDHLFVRGASTDVPVERKSAFGAEMGDIASLLRCCGEKSMIFVDELGRGTSPSDGTRLSAAILESMAQSGMSGIFATHLHEIFNLTNLVRNRIRPKRMAIREHRAEPHSSAWTYRLEDGICFDSMALVTAAHFGLPAYVLERANMLSAEVIPSSRESSLSLASPMLNGRSRNHCYDFQIIQTVESLALQRSVSIPPHWNVPASFEGRSAVYVIKIPSDPPSFYVGESDNLRKRIKQHRSKEGLWRDLEAVAVIAADSKTQARKWESELIQKFAMSGLPVVSTSDGRSSR